MQKLAVQSASEVGLSWTPTVRTAGNVGIPLTFGLFRPVVLLPRDFESWPRIEQRRALLHEMMHIRRRDSLGQWLARAMNILY